MMKTIILTNTQFKAVQSLARQDGKTFVKHLPDSSDFEPKQGSWKQIWISGKREVLWPKPTSKGEEIVGCHVVDIQTKGVYICPRSKTENSSIIGHEDEFYYLVEEDLLCPFELTDAIYKGNEESPKRGLEKALSKLSLIEDD